MWTRPRVILVRDRTVPRGTYCLSGAHPRVRQRKDTISQSDLQTVIIACVRDNKIFKCQTALVQGTGTGTRYTTREGNESGKRKGNNAK